ncbi:hypothetical protein GA0070616_2056 [Micromonospora nigra]|uniref:Uncharacterized protein n=1 Tax=Micromonospora nigra TaxID=145857 RepID=A0A1C6RTZ9_9ACTN|nr:hypothetical protein [Micromonospora nigra]SCL20685.1 hypothetical protein GA0070616_2056 [Micromonospora nigra]
MVAAPWSRIAPLSVTALLVVFLTGCAPSGADDPVAAPAAGDSGAELPGPPQAATTGKGRVSLLQKEGTEGPLRTLNVEPDGRWECIDCAGDGVTSTGRLDGEQVQRLQRLLADPALTGETDEARGYRVACVGALTSSLLTSAGLITSQDCPGEIRPPVAYEILLLLTQATPAVPTS